MEGAAAVPLTRQSQERRPAQSGVLSPMVPQYMPAMPSPFGMEGPFQHGAPPLVPGMEMPWLHQAMPPHMGMLASPLSLVSETA